MDLSSGVQYTADSARTSVNEGGESAENKDTVLSKENEVTVHEQAALQETISHPLQFSPEDDSPESVPDTNTNNINQNTKKGRRVTFGEGENIVSGYMDPPSPWNDGKILLSNIRFPSLNSLLLYVVVTREVFMVRIMTPTIKLRVSTYC